MMEMVINGVSTRKVSAITEELCGKQFSKSTISELCKNLDPVVDEFRNRKIDSKYPFVIVDALYTKVRETGRVRSKGLLLAIGVRDDGHREILGFCVADSESETSWSEFFETLKQRGLVDVDLIVSDNHGGLVAAIRKHFQGASWQRCQTHFSRNVLDKTPKCLQPKIKQCLSEIYNAPKLEIARTLRDEMLETYADSAPKAMETLESGFDDVMAVMTLPKKYRKRLRTSNSIERLNQEIRRRERVIRIFPNEDSLIRLIGAMLMEQDEKWTTGKKYLDMEEYHESRTKQKSIVAAWFYNRGNLHTFMDLANLRLKDILLTNRNWREFLQWIKKIIIISINMKTMKNRIMKNIIMKKNIKIRTIMGGSWPSQPSWNDDRRF